MSRTGFFLLVVVWVFFLLVQMFQSSLAVHMQTCSAQRSFSEESKDEI